MTKWVVPELKDLAPEVAIISAERHKELIKKECLLDALNECGVEYMLVYELALQKAAENEAMLADACERHG